jgi:uncharacterized membrane protein
MWYDLGIVDPSTLIRAIHTGFISIRREYGTMLRAFVGVLFFVFTVVGMATAGGPVGAEQTHIQSSIESQEFERTAFRINVSENGSARWTVIYRYDLSNETKRKRFATFASEFHDRSPDTVTWIAGEDRRKFNASEPRVVLQRSTTEPESGLKTMIAEALNNTMLPWLIGFAVLALVIVGGGVAYRTSAIGTEIPDEADTVTSTSTATISEEELMADEDRVLMLLRNNDGRMRQANIVNETNWSKSKVSMLLSEMDDEDLISKLQVGRENIISITGNEPEAARSPFEDEE